MRLLLRGSILGLGLSLAACQTTGAPPSTAALPSGPPASATTVTGGPPIVESTNIVLKSPDPTRWTGRRVPGGQVWICRPLACADRALIEARMTRSPTRDPDDEALRKLAKLAPTQVRARNLMIEAASDGARRVDVLSSGVTRLGGYKAVVLETRATGGGKPIYSISANLFVGTVLVKFVSSSPDRALARAVLDRFVAAMEVDDRPPQG
jgi:hypothetical protein